MTVFILGTIKHFDYFKIFQMLLSLNILELSEISINFSIPE